MATFGKTDNGTTTRERGNNTIGGSKYTLTAAVGFTGGLVSKISLRCQKNGTNVNAKCAIYKDDGAGNLPKTLLVSSSQSVISSAVLGYVDFTVSPAVYIPAGNYWIMSWTDGVPPNDINYACDSGVANAEYTENATYNGFPDLLGTGGTFDTPVCINATYTDANAPAGFLPLL